KGEAITIVTPAEIGRIKKIESLIMNPIPKPEPAFGFGPLPSWTDGALKEKKKKRPFRKKGAFNKKGKNKRESDNPKQ
ncbi:MAG TPA: hypothetical protein VHO68_03410, partial [Bacteroidales bacterium]|nr:hypothetical protein [Bacteroidales bacterium]